ncbi:MAG: DNA polymerase III subunit delta [Bacteroidales bacterium]|jgi:DNA polymerase-3 subunit delta|nr:DNA polymerase III subunit delta [Bacteroidales bacterium]
MTLTYEQIMSELKGKQYRPIYFLMGEEPYFIDAVTDYIAEHALQEHEKAFNLSVMYGKDVTIYQVIDAAKRFPMGASRSVVIVREAQDVTDPDDKRTKGKMDKLLFYAEKPLHSTVLVIAYKYKKALDKRSKLYKQLEKTAVILDAKKIYEDKIPGWIDNYLSGHGYTIDPKAALLLTDYLGNELGKVVNELDKLIIALSGEKTRKITADHIEKNVGISKEYNVFELQNALGEKNILKANRIVCYFSQNPKEHSLVGIVANLFVFFEKLLKYSYLSDKSQAIAIFKMNPYFLRDYENAARKYPAGKLVQIISLLREYDLKSKGIGSSSASDGDLMREMIYKIMH